MYVAYHAKRHQALPYNQGFNPRTYLHRSSREGGAGVEWNPFLKFWTCCSISKRFYLQWIAFEVLNKMRYILWVVTLLEACDVTEHGRHLEF